MAFVRALLSGLDVGQAARSVGRSRSTGYRWLQDPAVRRALGDAQSAAFLEVGAGLAARAWAALEEIEAVLLDGDAPYNARLRAGELIIDRALRFFEVMGLEQRLSELEAAIGDRTKGGSRWG